MAILDPKALEALTLHQRQLDMDGVEVGVSRQALDELISAYLSSTSAGVTEEQTPRVTEAMATAFALGASMGDGKFTSDSSALHPSPPPVSAPVGVSGGIAAIAAERRRQVETEGWTPEHDDKHNKGEMAGAAACYAMYDLSIPNIRLGHSVVLTIRDLWPWALSWWKPTDARCNLVKAGALIAAEIDRLDRAAPSTGAQDSAPQAEA